MQKRGEREGKQTKASRNKHKIFTEALGHEAGMRLHEPQQSPFRASNQPLFPSANKRITNMIFFPIRASKTDCKSLVVLLLFAIYTFPKYRRK